jgi:hypothetical protein
MTKLINLLHEINKLPPVGEKIGSGGSSTVYAHPTDPNKVIKIYRGPYIEDFTQRAEFFKKHPKYFPKVYGYGDRYIIEDKLDNKPIKQLNITLNSLANKLLGDDNPFTPDFLSYISRFDPNIEDEEEYDDYKYVVKKNPQIYKKISSLYNLYKNVQNLVGKQPKMAHAEGTIDFHSENIGVDNQGNFKLFDI